VSEFVTTTFSCTALTQPKYVFHLKLNVVIKIYHHINNFSNAAFRYLNRNVFKHLKKEYFCDMNFLSVQKIKKSCD
jgi:hypothetical protein